MNEMQRNDRRYNNTLPVNSRVALTIREMGYMCYKEMSTVQRYKFISYIRIC